MKIYKFTIFYRCRPEQSACFGGAGRLLTKVREIRNQDPNHTLILNAGDFYQGTIW
jgi:2',3'-cyclic-nucleotide 2'-phosphodiesterase (5'-nucleotidase family)